MHTIIFDVEKRLLEIIDTMPASRVCEAMRYSLMAGGKRIRPVLFCTVLKAYNISYQDYIDIACAIEMVHTYSLIHDDLPGMDNDDMRRGKPTCHRKFDEATAILAGDALLNEAVNVIINSDIESNLKLSCLSTLFTASGIQGMILGQQLDMEYENMNADIDTLKTIHSHKTGALISASMELGSIIGCKEDIPVWRTIGFDIGLAFQIQDDVLDVTSSNEILGKPVGSDIQNNKSTYVSLLSVEKASKLANTYFTNANEKIRSLNLHSDELLDIIKSIEKRVS